MRCRHPGVTMYKLPERTADDPIRIPVIYEETIFKDGPNEQTLTFADRRLVKVTYKHCWIYRKLVSWIRSL